MDKLYANHITRLDVLVFIFLIVDSIGLYLL
jgi:hypothetical protein